MTVLDLQQWNVAKQPALLRLNSCWNVSSGGAEAQPLGILGHG